MGGRSDSRTVGRSVGLFGGGLALGAAVLLSVRPTVRPSDDIHAEYVKYPSGKDTITGYLAYPERKDPAPGVVVIHEIFGMSDFVRQTTEQVAKDGQNRTSRRSRGSPRHRARGLCAPDRRGTR